MNAVLPSGRIIVDETRHLVALARGDDLAEHRLAHPVGADNQQAAQKAREIEDSLIAPCCWSQPVSQHYSEVTDQIRLEVRAMVEAGKSRDEILDYYVAEYGERILAAPRAEGFNALATFCCGWLWSWERGF